MPEGTPYPDSQSVPFFQNILAKGEYIGISGAELPYNRVCPCRLGSEYDTEYEDGNDTDDTEYED